MKLKKTHHFILFALTLLMAAASVFLIPHININGDMTKYLPDSSQMKAGIEILSAEFPEAMSQASGRISDADVPPFSVLLIASLMVVLILVFTSKSWMDPLVILTSAGLGILLNFGTNALLPSVSTTTNYIGAILQLVLSLDYSIILMNRYRQEKSVLNTPADALNLAIPKSFPSIISSSLTTIVGVLMLSLMKLKIGADIGIVLSKGVACSLVCTFTALPSLIILFSRLLMSSEKRHFIIPTDWLARFGYKYRIPLTISLVLLFCVTYYFQTRANISFCAVKCDENAPNVAILVYDNADEDAILDFADSTMQWDGVKSVLSYPTLLKKQMTADQMYKTLSEMQDSSQMLTPELVRLSYGMKFSDISDLSLSAQQITAFVESVANDPMMKGRLDPALLEKMALLKSFGDMPRDDAPAPNVNLKPTPLPAVKDSGNAATSAADDLAADTNASAGEGVSTSDNASSGNGAPTELATSAQTPQDNATAEEISPEKRMMTVTDFMNSLVAAGASPVVVGFRNLICADDTKLNPTQMTALVGSTMTQTKMVYSFAKSKLMTPREYVHFLADDLFNRRSLQAFVKEEEKQGLRRRMYLMDMAATGEKKPAAQWQKLLSEIVDEDFELSSSEALASAFNSDGSSKKTDAKAEPKQEQNAETQTTIGTEQKSEQSSIGAPIQPTGTLQRSPSKPVAPVYRPVRRNARDKAIDDILSGKKFTAAQLSKNIKLLGENVDPALVELLYKYYDCINNFDESRTMDMESFVTFIAEDLVNDSSFSAFIDEDTRELIGGAKLKLVEGAHMLKGQDHSIAVIVTDLPQESLQTYQTLDKLQELCDESFQAEHYLIGESVMFNEMRHGFSMDTKIVTWLTILAIFIIVALVFKSLIIPFLLVITVMTAVFVSVIFGDIFNGSVLYIAYLITQSILMGACIDYAILFTSYYRESRKTLDVLGSLKRSFKGTIYTVMTSGTIMMVAPGIMSATVDDSMISAILGSIAMGAAVALFLVLTVLPGALVVIDKLKKK